MDILGVDLDEINLDDYENFDEDGPETRCHPSRWCDWCLSEDDKKGIEPIFTDKVEKR